MRFGRALAVGLIGLLVAGLAACGDDDATDATSNDAAAGPDEVSGGLAGRSFLATGITRDGAEVPIVGGTEVRIGFEDARLTANAGCNTMGGAYEVVDGVLEVGDLAMTQIGCDPARAAQDDLVAALLTGEPRVKVDGDTLTLATDDVTMTLTADAGPTGGSAPIVGTRWIIESVVDGDAASSVPAGLTPTLQLTDDDEVVLTGTGCNLGRGRAAVRGDGFIEFGPIAGTKRMCEPDVMAFEDQLVSILDGEVAAAFDGQGRLILRKAGQGLELRAASG